MTIDLSKLNNAQFSALDWSIALTIGNGLTQNSDGTYTVTPATSGAAAGYLAAYDQNTGTLANPSAGDILFSTTTTVSAQPTNAPYGAVEYSFVEYDPTNPPSNQSVFPASGGIGAEVIAWNGTSVLVEQAISYGNGDSTITPDGQFFVFSTQDLSTYDGSIALDQQLNFNTNTADLPPFLCFLTGTQIATPTGEMNVESLSPGDVVLTASGTVRPIVWIGKGQVLATRGRRSAATPVIVRKGALAPNVPHRDIRVTKGHAFLLDDVLIPIEFLVNHRSILWDDMAQEVRLYHVELETHDVLLANGAPAESYRDDGNRWLFRNGNTGWNQPPKPPCAPVLTGGRKVDTMWRRLLDRAGQRPGLPLTDDPDVYLTIGGIRVEREQILKGAHIFRVLIRDTQAGVRIVSRAAAPDELGVARDPRVLGVALGRVTVRQGTRFRMIEADDERLVDGFHAYESLDFLRWTNGDAKLPASLFDGFSGSVEVILGIAATTHYVADDACARAA